MFGKSFQASGGVEIQAKNIPENSVDEFRKDWERKDHGLVSLND